MGNTESKQYEEDVKQIQKDIILIEASIDVYESLRENETTAKEADAAIGLLYGSKAELESYLQEIQLDKTMNRVSRTLPSRDKMMERFYLNLENIKQKIGEVPHKERPPPKLPEAPKSDSSPPQIKEEKKVEEVIQEEEDTFERELKERLNILKQS